MAAKSSVYHLVAIFVVIVWGTTFVSTKVLVNFGLLPSEIFLYRFLLAYISIWFFSPKKIFSQSLRDEGLFLLAGISGGSIYFLAENTALGITLASNVSLIICTAPLFTAILSRLVYRGDRLKSNFVLGSLLALLGVALVVFNGGFILKVNPLGDLLTILAALSWAVYGLVLRQVNRRYSSLFITRKVFFYGILTILPVFCIQPIHFNFDNLLQPVIYLNLLFLGLIASLLCYLLWNMTVSKLGVVRTTNYVYVIPLITLVTSVLVLDEVMTLVGIIGAVLILSGVYFAERGFGKR